MNSRIYIWGTGKGYKVMKAALDFSKISMLGFLDNKRELWGTQIDGYTVFAPNHNLKDYDYIIISTINDEDIESIVCQLMGVDPEKIITYFRLDNTGNYAVGSWEFIDMAIRTMHLMTKLTKKMQEQRIELLNLEYEVADKLKNSQYEFPHIESAEKALHKILKARLSMCRFGDGEFEIIFRRNRPVFQEEKADLAQRLKDILVNDQDNIITCIADNYGDLSCYTERAAKGIRDYMSPSVRKDHMAVIDLKKTYYDAYVSRPYMIYLNPIYAKKIFDLWKQIWKSREIILVEGRYTKSGFGNDLFDGAVKVERLLCPAENAWDYYKEIYDTVLDRVSREKLVLIALGPAATVLAYDLALAGYQAIDIGHLDNEYEWYIKGTTKIIPLENKYVHESGVIGRITEDTCDLDFEEQIIDKIGCE